MTTAYRFSEGSDQIRPVQFLSRGELEQLPVPFIRITTCGLLAVEVVAEMVSSDPPLARYVSLTPEQLRGRGTGPALMLLKLLLTRHERFASRGWLMEEFCHDGELFSSVRLDNIVSQLRGLLCPPAFPSLRKQLVVHVRSSRDDGYQLAAYPLIWVDQDALVWNVEQATRMERFGDRALPFWEQAYALARRGPYLPGERYADWASFQREQAASLLRQSVLALARLYQAQHGVAGEEEAMLILRTYWQEHQREEDVLRPLMELLGRRECVHEALGYYGQLCRLLQEDEYEPDSQTQDVAQYLRNKQIQRSPIVQTQHTSISAMSETKNSNEEDISPDEALLDWPALFSPLMQDDIVSFQKLVQEQTLPLSVEQLLKGEKFSMDILRRKLLQLGVIGTTFLLSPPLDSMKPHKDSLILLENEMTSKWMLYYTGGAIRASFGFDLWLQEIARNAQLARGTIFSEHANLVLCMSYQLQGCILRDMMRFEEAHKAFRQAFIVAQEMIHPEMIAATLAREGVTFIQQDQPTEAIGCLNHAQKLIKHLGFINLEGYILQALSEAQAKNQSPLSWKTLEDAEGFLEQKSQISEYSLTHFNTASVIAQRGVNAALLHQYSKSVELIDQSLKSYDATLIRGRARLLIQKAEAYWNLEAMDACVYSTQEAFLLAQSAGASKTMARAKNLHQVLIQSPWGKEREIIALSEIISPNHTS